MLKSEMNDKANEASKKMHMSKDNDLVKEFHYGQYMAYSSVYTMLEVQLSHLESRESLPIISEEILEYYLTPDECFKNNEDEKYFRYKVNNDILTFLPAVAYYNWIQFVR